MHNAITIGIIGAGRAGGALAAAFADAGYRVVALSSQASESARALAQQIGAIAVDAPVEVARAASLVFLTTPDAAIAPVCRTIAEARGWRVGQYVVHCSGALGREALADAAGVGALTGCFHPLQTLAGPTTAARLQGAYVAVDADPSLAVVLREMAHAIGAIPFDLDSRCRALYHTAAVMVSNYTVALYACGMRLLENAGVPDEVQARALLPLLRGAVESLERATPSEALTGPIARGDDATVARHIAALEAQMPQLLPIYRELGRVALSLARAIPEHRKQALTALLNDC
ncbi:Rossmann-like and DUF2520 domain-containing protein [Roseiflexus castenholzii]|uniref:NADP oxidoreductase coenzyme F420-dependent n=1 Tax=Roseiflexus castenholzii (strain DSM 13941 / HLO8) TaxID=383372 RepID=A7NQA9_ROSCS|nr:Rossmann-like and DUF2520 domain-containing protein [Roseiflexus castenholzii]ABU59755.1 NADP oxidoreductase coenzyme F420-dependent [Roseiflexus castenholzii DSM 13941]